MTFDLTDREHVSLDEIRALPGDSITVKLSPAAKYDVYRQLQHTVRFKDNSTMVDASSKLNWRSVTFA